MGIYEPLTRHLMSLSGPVWEANFSEIERVLQRSLPNSAYDHPTWWGNRRAGNHGHANAWREAGWQAKDVDIARKTVRFERVQSRVSDHPGDANASGNSDELESLFVKAIGMTGEPDRNKIMTMALTSLIQREAAKYFASLGGTMPDAQAAPRRRFPWQS